MAESEKGIGELIESLKRLARGTNKSFENLLTRSAEPITLHDSDLNWHCYSIQLDGNCLPRTRDLAYSLVDRMIDFAIPREQVERANAEFQNTGSTIGFARLSREAAKLFTTAETSGEAGELLLFAFAESVLGLPQLVCKMDLKTSSKMHVHGSDGLHVGVDGYGLIRLYWGESKINASRTAAFANCFASISPILSAQSQADVLDRQLIMRHINITDPKLVEALKRYLDPEGPDFQNVAYSGLCVIGFDYESYPTTVNELNNAELLERLLQDIPDWQNALITQANKTKIGQYHIHALCLPMPSVKEFRDEFNAAIGAR